MILSISSCTSSTQRNPGSSRRRICRLTRSSKEISGTNSAGLGPCHAKKSGKYIRAVFLQKDSTQGPELSSVTNTFKLLSKLLANFF